MGVIRFGGHLPRGGYDVHTDGRDPQEATTSSPVRRRLQAQAVRLVLDEGKSVGAVARDLDLTETALRAWVQRARANRTKGRTGLTTAEREELAQLRVLVRASFDASKQRYGSPRIHDDLLEQKSA